MAKHEAADSTHDKSSTYPGRSKLTVEASKSAKELRAQGKIKGDVPKPEK